IITDEAAQIQGGVGTAGSANIGDKYAMFEAIHGTAPRLIEEGLGAYANPASLLKAAEMMLRHIALADKADRLAAAMTAAEAAGMSMTGTAEGPTADEYVAEVLKNL
ncbi:MAG: isocitrate/isopropylmalate dehydrogenase family protein, partial [Clostridia bacterium]|nr:isocitrate/isopropylmalate dehydrogenase family protein [Clostridia bacterium]